MTGLPFNLLHSDGVFLLRGQCKIVTEESRARVIIHYRTLMNCGVAEKFPSPGFLFHLQPLDDLLLAIIAGFSAVWSPNRLEDSRYNTILDSG